MGKPWVPYVVQQGDHLQGLAFRFGSDPDTIWSNEKNKALAARRKNRDTLCAGDVLFVPAEPPPPLSLRQGTTNAYRAKVPKTPVRLNFDTKKLQVASKPFEVHGAGGSAPLTGTVTAEGKVEFEVPVTVRAVEVLIPDAGIHAVVHVGDLDPIEEMSGVVQRLRNLGWLPAGAEQSELWIGYAIRAFQQSKGLKADGNLTQETLDALVEAHRS